MTTSASTSLQQIHLSLNMEHILINHIVLNHNVDIYNKFT